MVILGVRGSNAVVMVAKRLTQLLILASKYKTIYDALVSVYVVLIRINNRSAVTPERVHWRV